MDNRQGTDTEQVKKAATRTKVNRKSKKIAQTKIVAAPAITLPPDTYFIVDGVLPSGSFNDAVFIADYLADTRNRPVEIRRTVHKGGWKTLIRLPRDVENREQIHCSYQAVVLDGDRVVFKGKEDEANAYLRGRGAGVVCRCGSRKLSTNQQKEDEAYKLENLKSEFRYQEMRLRQLRHQALMDGLTPAVKAFDRMYARLAKSKRAQDVYES